MKNVSFAGIKERIHLRVRFGEGGHQGEKFHCILTDELGTQQLDDECCTGFNLSVDTLEVINVIDRSSINFNDHIVGPKV